MNDIIQFSFPIEYENIRIDKAVFDYLNGQHSRSCIQNWIQQGVLLCNGAICNKKQTVKEGDSILIEIPAPELLDVVPQDIPLDILYEDNDLLVINKPKGMVVHPACGNPDKTLVNALLFHCKNSLSGINGVLRPGIVHRIDKDTSGLLVVAKNDNSHVFLANQIKEHTMTREYRAIVHGKFKTPEGTIDFPIGRHKIDRKKMCVTTQNSKNAITHYYLLKEYKKCSYIKCVLETGRTHQIRVHMSHIGHPLVGDSVYGRQENIRFFEGQCLHAKKLGFIHPTTKEYIEFDSQLPEYFVNYKNKLEAEI